MPFVFLNLHLRRSIACLSLLLLATMANPQTTTTTAAPTINLGIGAPKGAGVSAVGAPAAGALIAPVAAPATPLGVEATALPGLNALRSDAKAGVKPLGAETKGVGADGKADVKADGKGDAKTDAKADAKNPAPKGKGDKADKTASDGSEPPAAESIKDATADEVEFQRFVYSTTGQSLGLYGYELFGRGNNFASVQATPVPAGYILGPGDEIVVQVNGLVEVNERLVIDRDGRVLVPRIGPLNRAGVALNNAETVLSAHIGKVYRNFTVSVTMGRLRSIEVFVVGQARKPGKHLVSSLSSLINALFETGGPSANGSLRAIELRRQGKKVATVDMYAFLARGDNRADVPLLAGDIIFIPAAGPRAALLGTINAPSIYELTEGESINSILSMSGGLPTLAAPQKAQLERVDAQREIARYVEDFALDANGLELKLQAGDVLTVFQVSPQIANVVTLQGNVASPLRYTFKPGMKISDLLSDRRLLIPGSYWSQINQGQHSGSYSRAEVNLDYATVQRLDPATLRTTVVSFNPAKAIAQDTVENLELVSGDIVTIYRPNEAGPETENSITLRGESVGGTHRLVWREGDSIQTIAPRITELFAETSKQRPPRTLEAETNLYSSFEVNLNYATIQRRDPNSLRATLLSFNLVKALAGDTTESLELKSRDAIAIYGPNEAGPETENSITISGEIVGGTKRFVWRKGFTVRDIIPSTQWLVDYYNYWQRPSGRSLRNDINWDYAQVIRRVTATLSSKALTFNLGRAVLNGSPADNIALEPGDQITLFTTAQLAVPVEKRNQLVTVSGEVMIPGQYQLAPGETLPDLLKRAGGLSHNAFAYGIVFTRESTRVQQQETLEKSIRRLEADINSQAATALQNVVDAEKSAAVQAQIASQRILLNRLGSVKASGRIALELDADEPIPPAITLEDGDQITVPHRPSFVGVFGEVFAESSIIHKPGNTVRNYLSKAGLTRDADTDAVMVIRADGTVEGSTGGFLSFGVQGKTLNPGDSIFVPAIIDRRSAYTAFMQGAKDWTQIIANLGLGVAAIKTIGKL